MGRDKAGISIKNQLLFWRDFDFLKKKIAVTQFGFLKKQSLAMFCKHEKWKFWKRKRADFCGAKRFTKRLVWNAHLRLCKQPIQTGSKYVKNKVWLDCVGLFGMSKVYRGDVYSRMDTGGSPGPSGSNFFKLFYIYIYINYNIFHLYNWPFPKL